MTLSTKLKWHQNEKRWYVENTLRIQFIIAFNGNVADFGQNDKWARNWKAARESLTYNKLLMLSIRQKTQKFQMFT